MPITTEEPPGPPLHYCACGAAIGDGDWAYGRRQCVPCRLPRPLVLGQSSPRR